MPSVRTAREEHLPVLYAAELRSSLARRQTDVRQVRRGSLPIPPSRCGVLTEKTAVLSVDELALQTYESKIDDRRALVFQSSFDASESTPDPDE